MQFSAQTWQTLAVNAVIKVLSWHVPAFLCALLCSSSHITAANFTQNLYIHSASGHDTLRTAFSRTLTRVARTCTYAPSKLTEARQQVWHQQNLASSKPCRTCTAQTVSLHQHHNATQVKPQLNVFGPAPHKAKERANTAHCVCQYYVYPFML